MPPSETFRGTIGSQASPLTKFIGCKVQQHPIFVVFYELWQRSLGCGNHRGVICHCFDGAVTKSITKRRENDEMGFPYQIETVPEIWTEG